LIFPLLFPFSDALADIYGSQIAKSLIWYTAICETIFVLLTNAGIHLPSPSSWHHQNEYNFLVGGYAHILFANVSAMVISFYLNVNLLNKWRILSKGRYYYLRSLGATAVGEISYTIITNIIAYTGMLKWDEILNIIFSDYIFKLIYSVIIAYPAALFVVQIKMKHGVKNRYSNNFNPFQYKNFRKVVNLPETVLNKLK
jgi:uncharacterized integral membrane protein (TIGR00697 family)